MNIPQPKLQRPSLANKRSNPKSNATWATCFRLGYSIEMLGRTVRNQWRYVTNPQVPWPLRGSVMLCLAAYCLVSGVFGFVIGAGDYDHLAAYYEVAYRFWNGSNADIGAGIQALGTAWLPGFNPFFCGGRSLAADPQTPVFHPLLPLVGIFGSTWTVRLEMLAVLLLGTWGTVRWLRWFGLKSAQVAWGTLLYLAGGAIISKFRAGHVTLDFYFLYPLLLYTSYRLCENRGRLFYRLLALYCAAFVYAGLYKPNFFIYGLLPLAVEALTRSLLRRSARPVLSLLFATSMSALIQCASALPAWDYFSRFPRPPDHPFVWSHLYSFFANVLLPLKTIPSFLYGDFLFLPHEANLFIGPVALFFAAVGLWQWRGKRAEFHALLCLGLLSISLGLGSSSPGFQLFVPFTWFHSWWPGFDSIRVPVRFWTGSFFVLIVLSAAGFKIAAHRGLRQLQWLSAVLPLVVFCLFHLAVTIVPFENSLRLEKSYPTDFSQVHLDDPTRPLAAVSQGLSTIECLHNMEVFQAPDLQAGKLLEIFPATWVGTKRWENWSTIFLESENISTPQTLYQFNFNHSPFWRWHGTGAEVASKMGERFAIRATSSQVKGKLHFEAPFAMTGRKLALTGWAALFCLFFWAFRKKPIYRVGLSGSIAAGKSTLAGFFSESGIPVVDMDRVASEVRSIPSVQKRLKAKFPDAWDSEQALVTGDKLRKEIQENPRKKEWLENFLHVQMRNRFEAQCALLEAQGAKVVVCEGSLLLRTGYAEQLDELVFVDAARALRLERLRTRNPQWSESQRAAWLDGEISGEGGISELEAYAPFHRVENNGDTESLRARAREISQSWDASRNNSLASLQKT